MNHQKEQIFHNNEAKQFWNKSKTSQKLGERWQIPQNRISDIEMTKYIIFSEFQET